MKMDVAPYDPDPLLANVPPILRNQFKHLLSNQIGLLPITLNDLTLTKQRIINNHAYALNYIIRVPYAGKKLTWELIFDPKDIKDSPDFRFFDDFATNFNIDVITENLPSLSTWDVYNPQSLTILLREMLHFYRNVQIAKLEQENIFAQINSEYQVLSVEVPSNDMEIYLEPIGVHLVININVDTSSLPEYVQPNKSETLNPGPDMFLLKVSYQRMDASRVASSLQLSPRLEQALGGAKSLHIPPYSQSASLADYVALVKRMLKNHINRVENHHKLKKQYILFLCSMYPECLLEFDADTFANAVLLLDVDGNFCMVKIDIGEFFPEKPPTVTLHSMYCLSPKDCSETVNYNYSPRWSPEQMLNKLMENLRELIPKYNNHKH